ncbi:uncharacterized protein Hap1MRO34_016384 [Clarias gariepinus]
MWKLEVKYINAKKTVSIAANAMAEDDSQPSVLSKTQIDDATGPNNTPQQTVSIAANAMAEDDPQPSVLSKTQLLVQTTLLNRQSALQLMPWQRTTPSLPSCQRLSYWSKQHSSTEPSIVETIPPTERNEMLPPPSKRYKPSLLDHVTPSGVSAVRPSSKGKVFQRKKTSWQQTEVQAVERHMNRFIISGIVPAKNDCKKCLRAEPEAPEPGLVESVILRL